MRTSWIFVSTLAFATTALAADIGQVKVAKGAVQVEREGKRMDATVGMPIRSSDVLVTGANGSAGVTFSDNSLVSVGPNSVFAIDKYSFDTTTYAGEFEGSLRKGKLAAVSGKMVKQSPESMKIRTPSSVMAVRGTEFVVQVDEPPAAPVAAR
ncbi:MAG: FecR domain-containing protein [Betaproteobacteria bacterium]|nr:FecR domain-containing protein [Betaproteobacteria bacterium]